MNLPQFLTRFQGFSLSFMEGAEIAVDLGTSSTRIGIFGKGIVLQEPTFAGLNSKNNEYIFFGEEAKEIWGKAPLFISVIRPVQDSIISDFDSTVALVTRFFQRSVYPFFKNNLLKSKFTAYSVVPASATEVEQRALEEALVKAGAGRVMLIDKAIAAAAGADLSVFSNIPVFIIDLGAGIVEMAISIMGGIVVSKSLKGGDQMDKLIASYLHLKYGMIVGEATCEKLKAELFDLSGEKRVMTVRGKSLENGLPKSTRVTSEDIREALAVSLNQIIDGIKELLENVPPEVIDGIIKNGIYLTGGLANIPGLDKYIMTDIKIPVTVPDKPQDATIRGILKLLEQKDKMQKIVIK